MWVVWRQQCLLDCNMKPAQWGLLACQQKRTVWGENGSNCSSFLETEACVDGIDKWNALLNKYFHRESVLYLKYVQPHLFWLWLRSAYNESRTCISQFRFRMKTEEPLQYFAKIKIAEKHGLILEFITLCGFLVSPLLEGETKIVTLCAVVFRISSLTFLAIKKVFSSVRLMILKWKFYQCRRG